MDSDGIGGLRKNNQRTLTLRGAIVDRAGGVPIAGAEDAITRLRKAGVKVALTSGFDRGLIADIVAHCGWGDLFDAVVYPDEVPAGRPAPYLIFQAMQKTLVQPVAQVAAIGDTALDLQAGTNAGAGWVIRVFSGAHAGAALRPP